MPLEYMEINEIIGIIPARLDSQRFPRKLLAKLRGKPVLQRTFETGKESPLLDRIFIVTDSEEIAKHAYEWEAPFFMTSSQPRSGTERIVEAVNKYPLLQQADIIFNLQGDHPFTSPSTIKEITALFQKDPDLQVATAAVPIHKPQSIYSPNTVKCVMDKEQRALYFSRSPIPYPSAHSEDYPYYHHLGIYAYRTSLLKKYFELSIGPLEKMENLEQLRFLENGISIKVAIVDDMPKGIDTPQDLKECEEWVVI